MPIEIADATQINEKELQCIESYIFVRRGQDSTERVALTTPRLSGNRDSLRRMRPVSVLYSKISNNAEPPTSAWVEATTPYLTTDGKNSTLIPIRPQIYYNSLKGGTDVSATIDKMYWQDTSSVLEILKEALPIFRDKHSLSRIDLECVISSFENAINEKPAF